MWRDAAEAPPVELDTDGDGIPDSTDSDDDNDGVADQADAFPLDDTESVDTDGGGAGNNADPDDDNDGVVDIDDAFPLDESESLDSDGDGIGDNADPDTGAEPNGSNLALAGTTNQSSTGFGGVAGRATDGNRSGVWREGSVTHTQSEAQPWWDLSLAERSSIDSIVLYNRTDCCSNRLSDVHVFVSEEPFGDRTLADLLSDDGIWHELLPGAQASEVALSVDASGSYVRVQLDGTHALSLAEVEVVGRGQ